MNAEQLRLVRAVLELAMGECHVIRELALPRGAMWRYRDGWHFLKELASDRVPLARAVIGYSFRDSQDVADFLLGNFSDAQLCNFNLVGERL